MVGDSPEQIPKVQNVARRLHLSSVLVRTVNPLTKFGERNREIVRSAETHLQYLTGDPVGGSPFL